MVRERTPEELVAELDARLEANVMALDARIAAAEEVLTQRAAALEERAEAIELSARRLRRALADGRFDGDGDLVQALTTLLGMNPRDFREAILWLTEERRKARR